MFTNNKINNISSLELIIDCIFYIFAVFGLFLWFIKFLQISYNFFIQLFPYIAFLILLSIYLQIFLLLKSNIKINYNFDKFKYLFIFFPFSAIFLSFYFQDFNLANPDTMHFLGGVYESLKDTSDSFLVTMEGTGLKPESNKHMAQSWSESHLSVIMLLYSFLKIEPINSYFVIIPILAIFFSFLANLKLFINSNFQNVIFSFIFSSIIIVLINKDINALAYGTLRLYEGKGLFIIAGIPLIICNFFRMYHSVSPYTKLNLFISIILSAQFSSSGLYLSFILVFFLFLIEELIVYTKKKIDFLILIIDIKNSVIKFLKDYLPLFLINFLVLIFYYVNFPQSYYEYGYKYIPKLFGGSYYNYFFLVGFLLLSFLIFFKDHRELSLRILLYTLVFLNPVLKDILDFFIPIANFHWRFYWLFPYQFILIILFTIIHDKIFIKKY